ncbi:MAG TPA: hypothetical protein DCO72_07775 [Ruminococcus sp.]|nr:hypothetical protein [Ruminococcus sp.]
MFDANQYLEKIREMEHGTGRLDALADAIREADNASAHSWRIYFRYQFIQESVFHDDCFKAIIRFPELLQIYDEHPELQDEYEEDMMIAFKWILENSFDFYQISKAEIEKYFEEFKKRCQKCDVSLRVYHMKRTKYLLKVNMEEAQKEYKLFHRIPRDRFCDCLACEMNFDMYVSLKLDDEKQALEIAQPILKGERRCAEIPHCTYGHLCDYYLYHDNLDEASYYGNLCERYTDGKPEFLGQTGTLLELYSATDISHGWKLFKQTVADFVSCKNPSMRLEYARGAYRLMKVMVKLEEITNGDGYTQSKAVMVLPIKPTDKGIAFSELQDYFYNITKEQSELLDKRNESTYYMDILNKKFPEIDFEEAQAEAENPDTEKPAKKTTHGLIAKSPSMIAVVLKEHCTPSLFDLEKRIRENVPEDYKLMTALEEDETLFISLEHHGKLVELQMKMLVTDENYKIEARPVAFLERETFEKMLESPVKYVARFEIDGEPIFFYHQIMKIFSVLFPEMVGIIDLVTQHAYPENWVRFAGEYPEAIAPSDLFGLYLAGDSEQDTVWMTTLGMNCLGMRELEMYGSDTKNYTTFADMLDEIASQCVDRNMIADMGEPIAECACGEEKYSFTWSNTSVNEDSSQNLDNNLSGVILLMTDEGNILPPEFEYFADPDQIDYPRNRKNFHKRIDLAKKTFDTMKKALEEKPFDEASVRIAIELDEDTAEEYDYSIELLWADIDRVENGKVFAKFAETAETLPDIHEGDEIEVTPDNLTGWIVHFEDLEQSVTETLAYLLWKE